MGRALQVLGLSGIFVMGFAPTQGFAQDRTDDDNANNTQADTHHNTEEPKEAEHPVPVIEPSAETKTPPVGAVAPAPAPELPAAKPKRGDLSGNVSPYDNNMALTYNYVTGMVKGDAAGKNHWTIKSGNAQSGGLTTPFDGQRPSTGYNPMRKEGAIGLGTGGDNSDADTGTWFEGIMTTTYSSDAADDAVQANIVSVYGQ
jgi:Alpha-L-arabinofuranosidase B, catalytic